MINLYSILHESDNRCVIIRYNRKGYGRIWYVVMVCVLRLVEHIVSWVGPLKYWSF